ncbi:MAG: RNA polymerase [Ochotona cansus jeilongvirus]|uniref:RNA-directed RNA polymerase L n=1 Tax=Ochotona cansus jeilongvirus TaxID=3028509 RepID=A0AAT9TTJ5_9MONO|nr:MAG: RNA polymerase [Ochotona cansus jeilongvirus]
MEIPGINDVLYPECHLNSPIVAGKLVMLIEYTGLPNNQKLDDATILRFIEEKKENKTRTPIISSQLDLRNKLLLYYPNLSKLRHIPYPHGNKTLFNISEDEALQQIHCIMERAASCYSKISEVLISLRRSVVKKLVGLNVESLENNDMVERAIRNMPSIMKVTKYYKPFLFWFTIKYWMRLIIKNCGRRNSLSEYKIKVFDCKALLIVLNRNLCVIINKLDLTAHYLTFEMVLMCSDVTEGRVMIELGMLSDPRITTLHSKGLKLWSLFDNLFEELGNDNYNIVGLLEPLVLGFLQMKDESHLLRGAFLKFCLEELEKELKAHGFVHPDDLNSMISHLFDIFNLKDVHLIAEFFSFFRTFGHPILEAKEAADKVRVYMHRPKVVDFQVIMKGHALFCATIINGYRERHGGAWPPLKLPDHASNRIKSARNNDEALTDEITINNWKSFVGIKFDCIMPLTLDEDLTMYMKDKALASPREEWDSIYSREVYFDRVDSNYVSRRLVEVFLEDPEFDPFKIINYVINQEYLKDDSFNLSYSLKEKEIKRVGRLFAKMTYKMRACQVVAESLIASGVGKYFKENGIVKDEHDLLKTLHRLSISAVPRDHKFLHQSFHIKRNPDTHLIKGKNRIHTSPKKVKDSETDEYPQRVLNIGGNSNKIKYETISTFLTTDLQKFCLNWRSETTNIFAERLNEIYGLPGFFNWLHNRLEKSTIYVADPNCPPDITDRIPLDQAPNSQIFIKYPMGGIEGYCQKLWTIVTIPFLFLSAYEVGCKIAAVVQGDNQAIAITKRVHPNLPYRVKKNECALLAQQYFECLRKNMYSIGHNLKANETIISSHFMIYSKRIYYDGVALSQSLKPLSRAVFWSETIVDETRSACSNISTAICKSIEQGFDRWVGYSINSLKTMQQILISMKMTLNSTMTDDIVYPIYNSPNLIITASLVPAQLGGFSYLNMSRLYVRNIGDPVTASLADLKRMINAKLVEPSVLYRVMNQTPGLSSYLDWASDPYSINIPDSQSITIMLKNITARNVLSQSVNPMLQGLFHEDFEQEDNDLAAFLLDRPIIIPRAAREIIDNSITGARQEIAGMLDTTKGLIRTGLKLGGLRPRIVDKISLYDYNQFRLFVKMMTLKVKESSINWDACSVQLAIALRKRMWLHLTLGRPIYGLEVPDILEAVEGCTINQSENCWYCEAGHAEYCWLFVPRLCQLDTVSEETNSMRVPYFGSMTDERSDIKLGHIKSSSRSLKAAVRIATIYTWAFGDTDECWNEAWYLASYRANVDLDELKAITPISTSNNMAHRMRDRSTQMKYTGSSLNRVGRYVVISNDKLNFVIDEVKVDTNLVYQQIMLTGISLLEDLYRYQDNTGQSNLVVHLHIVRNCCVIKMESHPYVKSNLIVPTLRSVNNNRLIYDPDPIIEKEKNVLQQQVFKKGMLIFPKWKLSELEVLLAQSLALTVVDIITREDRDHLNNQKVLENDDNINSLLTDFLLVQPKLLSLHVGMALAISWGFNIYYRRPEGKHQMIETVHTILTQLPKSYMSILINVFSHPLVFRRFWDDGLVEPVYGPNLRSQDYVRTSVDFLVTSYSLYLDFWLNSGTDDYILTEPKEEIVDYRYESVQSRHLCCLANLYLTRKQMPKIRGLTAIEKCTILTDSLNAAKKGEISSRVWNLKPLSVVVYPASITYLRRSSIKYIRIQKALVRDLNYQIAKSLELEEEKRRNLAGFQLPKEVILKDNRMRRLSYNLLLSDDLRSLIPLGSNRSQMNRWECHVLRRVGINTTSCYKAVEIARYISQYLDDQGTRLFLGEGSGGMMAVYDALTGPADNYYNSGVFNEVFLGQRVLEIEPAEFKMVARNSPYQNQDNFRVNVLFNGRPESTWVGNFECYQYIMNTMRGKDVNLIHSDIEGSHDKDDEVLKNEGAHLLSFVINLGNEGTVVILKICPSKNNWYTQFIRLLATYVNDLEVLFPAYSNPYSNEIYLFGKGVKKSPYLQPSEVIKLMENQNNNNLLALNDNIANVKMDIFQNLISDLMEGHQYNKGEISNLTDIEQILITIGFQINGPKIIKSLTQHDVGSGHQVLISNIRSAILYYRRLQEDEQNDMTILTPYPLSKETKSEVVKESLLKKVSLLLILYHKNEKIGVRMQLIQRLKQGILYTNLKHYDLDYLFNTGELKVFQQEISYKQMSIHLENKEVKEWWKIVGYSYLFKEDG